MLESDFYATEIKFWFIYLKMLGLYLYTLITNHKSCNMSSILNKLILQKKLQKIVTNNVFCKKEIKNTTKKSNIKTLDGAGNWTEELSHPKPMRYLCTTESTEGNECSQAI